MAPEPQLPVTKALQKPPKLDLTKGLERTKELMRENEEWVKEMAKK